MLFVFAVYFVAPFAGAPIEILPIGELTSGQEVFFYKAERPFYSSRTICIADLMSPKLKAVAIGKRLHLGHRNHIRAGAS